MKIHIYLIMFIVVAIILNVVNYTYFINLLLITWYIASVLIIYLAIRLSIKYRFKQINIKKIIEAIKSKSNNNITPLSSLCISLAAKIGVGSLSGVALAIYFGGIGTIFWLVIISLLVSINAYQECILGIKHRKQINNMFVGGPSYYISKALGNKKLGLLYGILIIVTYSGLFLSIQANTIVSVTHYFNIGTRYVVIVLSIITMIIIINGTKGVITVNGKLVPVMLIFYFLLGVYILFTNIDMLPQIIIKVIREAFNIRSIISVFLIGMQRAIFITESSIGTSAISASSCDNDSKKQGMLEVFGIHITIFLVCLTTFLIIATSDFQTVNFQNINGIEIVLYAFNYHFGINGGLILAITSILFAFSTIISSYFFGESNLLIFSKEKNINIIYKLIFIIIIIVSCYIRANILWNLTDYFVAILAIINVYAMIKIGKNSC